MTFSKLFSFSLVFHSSPEFILFCSIVFILFYYNDEVAEVTISSFIFKFIFFFYVVEKDEYYVVEKDEFLQTEKY